MSATPFDSKGDRPRGAVLVVHGLNTKPDAMNDLVQVMLAFGYHCQRVSLYGDLPTRRARSDAIVTGWTQALARAYAGTQTRWPGAPVYAMSYSIGALLTLHLLNVSPDVTFERMVLLAPPVALTRKANLVRLLTPLVPLGAVLPSAAPREVRQRWGTPVAEYAAMLSLVQRLHTVEEGQKLSRIPTSVVLDHRDELVSREGVRAWIRRNGLHSWQVHVLGRRDSPRRLPRHLIVSRRALGPRAWERLTGEVVRHFDAAAPGQPGPLPPRR